MNTKKRSTIILTVLAMVMLLALPGTMVVHSQDSTPAPTPTIVPTMMMGGESCSASAAKVNWYVGLGSGTDADVIPKEHAWVDAYNAAHTDTCLTLQIVRNPQSYDTLTTMIAAGTPPDIVGPVGVEGRERFRGAWADVAPLAKAANVDLSKYDPTLLKFLQDSGVQVGLPFAMFPGVLYYNKDLFDEAKLPYPPHKVGEQYQGKEWNIDALNALAKQLTVDKNGADATDPKFDPKSITQFGFWEGFQDGVRLTPLWGPGTPFDAQHNAKIPDNWKAAWTWYYNSMWKDYIAPNADYANSDVMAKGNPFSSGNVAMTWSFTWYTCCFDLKKINWDMAVVPSYNGVTTAGMNADTFAIPAGSKNQAAAFKVLKDMIVDPQLSALYGGIPGNLDGRDAFFKTMDANVAPNKIDWQVALDMLKYPDIPNHEAWMPNMTKAYDLLDKFNTKMTETPGLDMAKELDQLQSDLDAIYKAAPAQ